MVNDYFVEFGGGVSELSKGKWIEERFENMRYSAYTALSYSDVYWPKRWHFNLEFHEGTTINIDEI